MSSRLNVAASSLSRERPRIILAGYKDSPRSMSGHFLQGPLGHDEVGGGHGISATSFLSDSSQDSVRAGSSRIRLMAPEMTQVGCDPPWDALGGTPRAGEAGEAGDAGVTEALAKYKRHFQGVTSISRLFAQPSMEGVSVLSSVLSSCPCVQQGGLAVGQVGRRACVKVCCCVCCGAGSKSHLGVVADLTSMPICFFECVSFEFAASGKGGLVEGR